MIHDQNAADYCPTCGQPRERFSTIFERFGLRMGPGNALSFGGRSANLTPQRAEFMRILLERERASSEFVQLRTCPDVLSNVVHVHACILRRTVRELTGGAVVIRTVWGWGYELALAQAEAA